MGVSLFLCYARSGGTLLNQMIGSLPNVVVLSEVSPYGGGWGRLADKSPTTPAEQLRQWYGLKIHKGSYESELAQAVEVCGKLGKKLVIRDWSFISFTPAIQNGFLPPQRFVTLDALNRLGVDVATFALVRHPISIWMSRREPANDDEFLLPYMNYVSQLAELAVPLFHYEDLCATPDQVMDNITDVIGVDSSDKAWRAFNTFEFVSGDVQNAQSIERHLGPQAIISMTQPKPKNYELFVKLHFRHELQRASRLSGYASPSKLNLLGMVGKVAMNRLRAVVANEGPRNA